MTPVVIVGGALANKPHNGGEAWVRMSWAAGLRRLGFDVYFVEQIAAASCTDAAGHPAAAGASAQRRYFDDVTRAFGLADRSALVVTGGGGSGAETVCAGVPWDALLRAASGCELLVNISGHLTCRPLLDRVRRRAYVDIDPGFTQFWHADPATPFEVAGHDHYFTIGENIGDADCPIPTAGVAWQTVRQPVVLDDWPVVPAPRPNRFTTVASWRGAFGPVDFGGRRFGLKVHEFRKVLDLPGRLGGTTPAVYRTAAEFELALAIHPADAADLAALERNHWRVVSPAAVAADPAAFRDYVQGSGAEFSVAQGIYVDTNSGWFSDRTVRYLAAGRPALVQQTGFAGHLPTGEGLLAFATADEAAAGAESILRDYDRHAQAARAIAAEFFDSDRVLGRFLAAAGVGL